MFVVHNEINNENQIEAIVVGLSEKHSKLEGIVGELDNQLEGQLTALLKDGDISPKRGKLSKIHTFGKTMYKRIIIVGTGRADKLSFEELRKVFGKVGKSLQESKLQSAVVAIDSFVTSDLAVHDVAHALGESIPLATYRYDGYKQKSNEPEVKLEEVVLLTDEDKSEVEASVHVGYVFAKGTNSARTLVNMPGNMLTATELANHAAALAEKYGFELEILEKEDMEKLGMGALLAVNKGSVEPPKMIVLKHQGKEEWTDVIGLVGKGITFDTGGYSIKPKDGIVGMKTDMGGAAAVLGAMEAIGELKPEQNVVAVIASTDNMISGNAFKPDDVITSMSGKTIEILNTDAEGRLVLADAVTYAKQHGANYLVDVATLTGGVIVALGNHTTGAMTNDEDWFEQVLEASYEAGEEMWRLPIFDRAKSECATVK